MRRPRPSLLATGLFWKNTCEYFCCLEVKITPHVPMKEYVAVCAGVAELAIGREVLKIGLGLRTANLVSTSPSTFETAKAFAQEG